MAAQAPQLSAEAARSRARGVLSALAGALLLAATVYLVDPPALLARLSRLRWGLVVLGAGLAPAQLSWAALRWRMVARQLGVPLSHAEATREYALSTLLNHMLPFGVAGDALRIARHARAAGSVELSVHAVLLERLLGQLVVVAWVLAVLPLWLGAQLGLAALGGVLAAGYGLRRLPSAARGTRGRLRRSLCMLAEALQQVLASPRSLLQHWAVSSLLALSIAAQLYCALWSLDLTLPPLTAAKVFPLMLLAMALPLSFAGFGPREAITAQLYDALHLSAADGAAFALAFGTITLCANVPCLCLWLWLKPMAPTPKASAA